MNHGLKLEKISNSQIVKNPFLGHINTRGSRRVTENTLHIDLGTRRGAEQRDKSVAFPITQLLPSHNT